MLAPCTLIDERYEVESSLGIGGYGAVYKAKQLQFGRTVALKMLATNVLQQDDGPARFEREAQAVNALKHKNIVSFYGYGVWNQAPYMVVEFVDGRSVQTEIERAGKMDPRRALMVVKQVFEGLASAHASGVIHRDLKPSNIMLTLPDSSAIESVKIIDFGLAKLMPGYGIPGQKLTETGYALGSCHYMPPEQALGIAVDPRADIYAAGCVLYFMLTGRVPFDADNNIAIMMQHLNALAEPVSDSLENHPLARPLSSFVDNCMAKERDDRYVDCNQALVHIEAMLRGDTKSVQSNVNRSRTRKPFAVSIRLLVSLTFVALLLLGVVAYVTRTPALTARELLRTRVGIAKIGTSDAVSRQVWEQIYSMNTLDHSLSAEDELAVIVNLIEVRLLAADPLSEAPLLRRLLQLIRSEKLDADDVVEAAYLLYMLEKFDTSESILKGILHGGYSPDSIPSLRCKRWATEVLMAVYTHKGNWGEIISLSRKYSNMTTGMSYWLSIAYLLSGDSANSSKALSKNVASRSSGWQDGKLEAQRARIYLAQSHPKAALEELEVLQSTSCPPTLDLVVLKLAALTGTRDFTSAQSTLNQVLNHKVPRVIDGEIFRYDVELAARYMESSSDKLLRSSASAVRDVERELRSK